MTRNTGKETGVSEESQQGLRCKYHSVRMSSLSRKDRLHGQTERRKTKRTLMTA